MPNIHLRLSGCIQIIDVSLRRWILIGWLRSRNQKWLNQRIMHMWGPSIDPWLDLPTPWPSGDYHLHLWPIHIISVVATMELFYFRCSFFELQRSTVVHEKEYYKKHVSMTRRIHTQKRPQKDKLCCLRWIIGPRQWYSSNHDPHRRYLPHNFSENNRPESSVFSLFFNIYIFHIFILSIGKAQKLYAQML